eukprot:10534741-Alexandrium_andersonii.AAC.1
MGSSGPPRRVRLAYLALEGEGGSAPVSANPVPGNVTSVVSDVASLGAGSSYGPVTNRADPRVQQR